VSDVLKHDGGAEAGCLTSAQGKVTLRITVAITCTVAGLLWLPLALPLGSPWAALAAQLVVAVPIPIWLGLTAWNRVRKSDGRLQGARLALAAVIIGGLNIVVSVVAVLLCLAGLWLYPLWLVGVLQGAWP
jgi:hypothetical protein